MPYTLATLLASLRLSTLSCAAGCSDPSYEATTATLTASSDTRSQGLGAPNSAGAVVTDFQSAAGNLQPVETTLQPVWDSCITNVHTTNTFQARLLEEGSVCAVDASTIAAPLVSQTAAATPVRASAAAAAAAGGEAAALSVIPNHRHTGQSRLGMLPDTTGLGSASSPSSGSSTSSQSGGHLQSSGLHVMSTSTASGLLYSAPRASQPASGLLQEGHLGTQGARASQDDAHGAVPPSSGLLPAGHLSIQGTRASPAGSSAESTADTMPASHTCTIAEHNNSSQQTLNPAQQAPVKHPMLSLNGGVADLGQSMSVHHQAKAGHQTWAGHQAQPASPKVQGTKGSSEQSHAQTHSTDTVHPGEGTVWAAASGGATLAKVTW